MKYQDGTKPSNVQAMSQEDKEWLEKAMQEYTFNDADRLKEICEQMKDDISSNFGMVSGDGDEPPKEEGKADEEGQ